MTVSKIYLITNVISLSLFIVEQKCLLENYVARNHTLYLNIVYIAVINFYASITHT